MADVRWCGGGHCRAAAASYCRNMTSRKTLAGSALVAAAFAVLGFFVLPMIYGFLIMAGWINR